MVLNTALDVPKLNPNTPTLMDGEVRLFKRKCSSVWQVAFTINGRQVRVSMKKRILKNVKEAARKICLDYRFLQKNGLPVISKRFADVAAMCRATMKEQLENGVGKKSFCDYIIVIDKYLVPFFGDLLVTSIDYEMLQGFARWREEKMGREPRSSTLTTHNSALNRIFDEAVARGYMNKSQIPVLVNKGRDSVRRPDFTREEYATLIRKLPSWIDAGREGKSRDMRHLLRDYILILANTDIAQGVDAADNKDEGAGDQGIMFGYATNETEELMPAPIQYSHAILRRLAEVRKDGTEPTLGADAKSQLSVRYENGKPVGVTSIV